MDQREAAVLRLRFGWTRGPKTLKEIAIASPDARAVRQIENEAWAS